ncbi:peptidoglycan bridge formation glycyltransferase FemA/FemB family protein [Marinilabiliaceae bacterium JC040]|nr:peptidoglycan bridge formation glycyltransferase FemA/FemB family protein [Marinilabiliaceae bacterium JC040]
MNLKIINTLDEPKGIEVIYAKKEYLKSIASKYGWLSCLNDEEIIYTIPYVIKKKLFFKYIQFQYSGIKLANTDVTYKQYYDTILDFLKNQNCFDFVGVPPTHVLFSDYPNNSIVANFGSYRINLCQTEDELWKNIHSKHKNVIRKSINSNVEICIGFEYINDAIKLLNNTNKLAGFSLINKDDFINKNSSLFNIGGIVVFVAYKDKIPQSCAIYRVDKNTVYYEQGGSCIKPFTGSGNLLHWEAIKYFKNNNCKVYDFVGARISPNKGSKLEGIQRFKSRFGGDLVKGYLWKYPINLFKYRLFMFLFWIKTKRKEDLIDQENINKQSITSSI